MPGKCIHLLFLFFLTSAACASETGANASPDGGDAATSVDVGGAPSGDTIQVEDDASRRTPADTSNPDTTDPVQEVARATCEAPIGGWVPLLVDHAYEAFPGYDDELDAFDLAALPGTLDLSDIGLIQRSLAAYMLEIDLDEIGDTLNRDEVLANEPMGRAVLGAYAEAAADGKTGVDLPFLRRGLHRYYQCDRAFPLTLEGFKKAIYDYSELVSYDVLSVPKNRTRRLREDHEQGVYIAETIVQAKAGEEVRETEIQLTKHRKDNAIDFLVYDDEGRLMDRSEFVTAAGTDIGGASPYGCIACHFEPGTFRINVIFPIMDAVAPK